MLSSEIELNSQALPKGFERDFDAHVYYEMKNRKEARSLRESALLAFQNSPVFVGKLVDRKIGPHPLPMFELNFPKRFLEEAMLWLTQNRGALNVLVHEVTGDDFRDHSSGATWLGRPLSLDVSKLD